MAKKSNPAKTVKNSNGKAKVSEHVLNRSKRAKQLDAIYRSPRKMIEFIKADKQAVQIVSREIASANKRYNTNFELKMLTTKVYDLAPDFWLYGKKPHTAENKRKKWGFFWTLALINKQVEQYSKTRATAKKVTNKAAKKTTAKVTRPNRKTKQLQKVA